tara:strand:+ start:1607 stop:2233 length:627 start_codon:yes stop_codon:yes gene_type:complete
MKKETKAIERLCDAQSKVSSHYFIKNSGKVLNLVPDLYEAWHAGKSSWKNLKSLNKNSIGIEINNPGHDFGYKNFEFKQILSLKKLLKHLIKKYNIKLENILGHSDIAPYRKKDPGEKFPWNDLYKNNLCHWHNLDKKVIKRFRKIKLNASEEKKFLKNLFKIGYSRINIRQTNESRIILVKAFQRRFRQELVDGKIDKECFLISKNL